MAKTVKIDLRDHAGVPAGGAGMRRDRVTVWAPTFRPATGGDWTVGPQPVEYFFEDGLVSIPNVDAGPLVVRFDVDQMDGTDTFTVTVPEGDGVISMRELLADEYEYAPIVISEARRVLASARDLLGQSESAASAAKASQSAAESSATAAKSSQEQAASSASEAASSASAAKSSQEKAASSASAAGTAKTKAETAAESASSSLTQVQQIATSTSWNGDRVTVNGKTSPPLTGPAGTTAWSGITGKPSTFPPATHTHTTAQVEGLGTALDGKAAKSHTHVSADISDAQNGYTLTSVATNSGRLVEISSNGTLEVHAANMTNGNGNAVTNKAYVDGAVAKVDSRVTASQKVTTASDTRWQVWRVGQMVTLTCVNITPHDNVVIPANFHPPAAIYAEDGSILSMDGALFISRSEFSGTFTYIVTS